MPALRIHQHGIDDHGSRFHFHHRPFRPARHVGCVAPLEHDAFDRFGILARTGGGRVGARRCQLIPGFERDERREIDARIVEPRNEFLQPRAALRERQAAQVLVTSASRS